MEIAEFLLARITEDEAVARAATPGPWSVDSEIYAEAIHGPDGASPVAGGRWGGEASVFDSTADALHIARHNPARVLAECDAKRRILDEHPNRGSCDTCLDSLESEEGAEGDAYSYASMKWEPCPTLRFLALPYADHPDYQPEWKV